MIIGITGRAQCGKDTLATAMWEPTRRDYPKEVVPPICEILHFADTLRDVVQAAFGSRYETAEEKAAVDEWWNARLGRKPDPGPVFDAPRLLDGAPITGRFILQKVGTELFRARVSPDFWLFAMERRIATSKAKHHIIADIRFDNEAQWVRAHDGIVIGLTRQDQGELPADAHASERGVDWGLISEVHRCDSPDAVRTLGRVLSRTYLG
jgi:hypothetical protein